MSARKRPLIGVTGRRKTGAQIIGTAETFHHLDGDFYYADNALGILEAGGLPFNLPLDVDPTLYIDRLDGILLTGGAPVGTENYGAASETDEFPPALPAMAANRARFGS